MAGRSAKPLLVALVIFLYAPFAYHHGWKLLPGSSVDFPSYHYGAVMAFKMAETPYGPRAFDWASEQMHQHLPPFVYPPPSLLAFWPLALMPFGVGKTLFIVASHVCYLWAIWVILARLTPLPVETRLRDLTLVVGLVYFVLFDPAIVTLGVGQVNLIVLPFLFLALAGMRTNAAAWQIALPLSLAILLKTYPAVLLLPLLFRKQFMAIALTCVFFGVYTVIAAAVLPLEVWSTWFRLVLPEGGYASGAAAAAPWNQNINAFVSRLFLPNPFTEVPLAWAGAAKPIGTALSLVVLGVTALFGFQAARRTGDRRMSEVEISAYLLMIFLIAPLSWEHHLVYILPAAIFAITLLMAKEVRGSTAVLLVAALCVIAWRVPFWEEPLRRGVWTLLISVKFYAAVVLWVFFVNRLRTLRAATPASLPATR
jgi:alpha-1,2-mannosyltransferase